MRLSSEPIIAHHFRLRGSLRPQDGRLGSQRRCQRRRRSKSRRVRVGEGEAKRHRCLDSRSLYVLSCQRLLPRDLWSPREPEAAQRAEAEARGVVVARDSAPLSISRLLCRRWRRDAVVRSPQGCLMIMTPPVTSQMQCVQSYQSRT